jgi:hypothetical protein
MKQNLKIKFAMQKHVKIVLYYICKPSTRQLQHNIPKEIVRYTRHHLSLKNVKRQKITKYKKKEVTIFFL